MAFSNPWQPNTGFHQPMQFNQYQPTAQNFFPQNQQPQSPPQPQQRNVLSGRIVNSAGEIMPNEVPMDGNVGIFPQADGACIYVKAWNPNGTISTLKFVQEPTETAEKLPIGDDGYSVLIERLDKIEKMLSKPYRNKKPYHNPNQNGGKEVNNNESDVKLRDEHD